ALYDQYITEGKTFAPKLKKALAAGSSLSPLEIGKTMNLNVAEPTFWNKGINVFKRLLDNLEKTIQQ
ncbi:MAG: hypothetical protein WC325_11585, partial [Candidatus Bathyarchaeia archaeon]